MSIPRHTIAVVALGLLGTSTAIARADVHELHTMARQTPESALSLESRYAGFRTDGSFPVNYEGSYLLFDVAAHYVTRWGPGVYAHLPVTMRLDGCCGDAMPFEGFELGLLYAVPVRRWADVVAHGGVGALGAQADDDTIPWRMGDASRMHGPWIRLGVSAMLRSGRWFSQLDLGLDSPSHDDKLSQAGYLSPAVPRVSASAGVGVEVDKVDCTIELTGAKQDVATYFSSVALGVRLPARAVQPGLAVEVGQTSDVPGEWFAIIASVTMHSQRQPRRRSTRRAPRGRRGDTLLERTDMTP